MPGCEPGWGSMLSSVVSHVSQLLPAPARPSPLAPLLKPSPPSSDDSDQHSRYRYSKIVIKSPKIILMYKGLIFSVVGCQRKRHGSFWRNAVRTTSHFKVHTLSTHVIFFVSLRNPLFPGLVLAACLAATARVACPNSPHCTLRASVVTNLRQHLSPAPRHGALSAPLEVSWRLEPVEDREQLWTLAHALTSHLTQAKADRLAIR